MAIVENILKIGDWIQGKIRTKSGVFVLGVFIGSLPAATVSYVLYEDIKYKDERLMMEVERTKVVEKEKDLWQERAFNAETTCLKKIKEMASFFQDLEGMYDHKEQVSREFIESQEKQLDKYEDLTKTLNTLKKDLDEK